MDLTGVLALGVNVQGADAHLGRRHFLHPRVAEMEDWMKEFEWESLESMRGDLSLAKCPDPSAYERANYVRMLQGWRSQ